MHTYGWFMLYSTNQQHCEGINLKLKIKKNDNLIKKDASEKQLASIIFSKNNSSDMNNIYKILM